MKTLRRLIYGEVIGSIVFVTLGFLSLFFFFDFVDELSQVRGKASSDYQLVDALVYVVLQVPNHLYQLLPITALIGTIFVMARLAQSSEFTILRTSGLGPWRALRLLSMLGLGLVLLTFVVGDYLAPLADRNAQLLKARFKGQISIGKTGAWLKERQTYSQVAVNVRALAPDASMRDVHIFEFDNSGLLISMTVAERARFGSDEAWQLQQVERTEFAARGTDAAHVDRQKLDSFRWPTSISAEMV